MNKKVNVYLMYAIVFLQGLVFYGPVATLYRVSRGLSMSDTFIIESIYMVLALSFEVPWGWFADRFGYKTTLIISNILLFISKIVFFTAHSFFMFLLERVLMAVAFAGISGCDIALLYSSVENKDAEKVFGIYTAASSSGYLLASLISTVMVMKSIDTTVMYSIFPYGIAAVLTLFIENTVIIDKEKPNIRASFNDLLSNKMILLLVLSCSFAGEVTHSIVVFLNQLQYLRSGISIRYFGVLAAFIGLASLLSSRSFILTNRFGEKKTVQGLLTILLSCCILLIFTSNPVISILLIAALQGSFSTMQPVIMNIENRTVSTCNRATVLSMYAMIGDIASSIANLSIGKSADYSAATAFITCSIIAAAGAILAVVYFGIYNFKK